MPAVKITFLPVPLILVDLGQIAVDVAQVLLTMGMGECLEKKFFGKFFLPHRNGIGGDHPKQGWLGKLEPKVFLFRQVRAKTVHQLLFPDRKLEIEPV